MRKRRKSNVKVVDERTEWFKKEVWNDFDNLAIFISDLDIDDESKDYIIEEINTLADLTTALLNHVRVPKRGFKYPFDPDDAS